MLAHSHLNVKKKWINDFVCNQFKCEILNRPAHRHTDIVPYCLSATQASIVHAPRLYRPRVEHTR